MFFATYGWVGFMSSNKSEDILVSMCLSTKKTLYKKCGFFRENADLVLRSQLCSSQATNRSKNEFTNFPE